MNSTTTQNMVFGVSKTPRTITWGYTAPENRPRTVIQIRRQRDTSQHTHIRRPCSMPCSTQHPKRTICRIQSHASQQERIKAAQDRGLAPRGWRAIASEAQVAAHCRNTRDDQRAEAAQSMRHWPADPPPRAKHASSMPPSVPVERRASQLIQLVGLCTFATAGRTDVQTPRDLITPANAKRQAGGRRGSGSNLHRN
jgi:hypothetical protein